MVDFTSRQLRAFRLVAQHRSFSRAAEAMFITPSGLSVVIRELEKQLGFRLFDRTSRHVALTRHGSELLAVVQASLDQLDGAVSRIGQSVTEASHSLSLGASPLVAANVLPEAIKAFEANRPNLRIELFEGDPSTILQRVRSGTLDMGLGTFFKRVSGIRRTPFFRFVLMVIRPDSDPTFRPASTTWGALKSDTLVSLPPTNPVQQLIDRHLAEARIVFRRNLILNYLETVIAMVEAGKGLAIVPSFAIPACRRRRVLISHLTNPVVSLDFYHITNRGRKLPPDAEGFTSFLKGYVARWAGRSGVLT